MRDYDMGDFGDPASASVAGPLIGGGVAQVGILASKLMFAGKAPAKWAGLIGTLLGGAVSGFMIFTGRRELGISGLITAALVGIPRQLEDLMAPGGMSGLGVITPTELAAWGAEGEPMVQLLNPGSGLGITVPEEADMMGAPPVELLGFGSNFMNAQ